MSATRARAQRGDGARRGDGAQRGDGARRGIRARARATLALGARFCVLLGLIAQAALIYLRMRAAASPRASAPAVCDNNAASGARARLLRAQRRFAARFVRVATRYRGGLIKIGQVASLRVDILPEEVSDELARLQDRVTPQPFDAIAAQIEATLHARPDALYQHFEREPLAAASLGQVHRARLASGEDVAVKVLYPRIEESVAVDLAGLRFGLWLFNFVTVADLRVVAREIQASLHGEMDYEAEGRACEEVTANLARDRLLAAHIRTPKIYWSHTGRRVLTMEFLPGAKINDRAALAALDVPARTLVNRIARAFLHMIFRDGFFHADPHPGNLLVDADGRIGLIDFGMHKRIGPKLRALLRETLLATMNRDAPRYARAFLSAGMIDARDLGAVLEIARLSFSDATWNRTPSELAQLDLRAYATRLRAQTKRVRSFRLPEGLVLFTRALTLLLGLASELAPGIRPLEIVGPYLLAFLHENPRAHRDAADALHSPSHTPDTAHAPRAEQAHAD